MKTMLATRPNRTLAHPPAQAARYQVPGRLPPEVHENVREALLLFHRKMQEHPPPGVEAAVAYTKASWARPLAEFTLYVIGQAPDRWDLMESVVDATTPYLLESNPVAKPYLLDEWERTAEAEGPLWRYVSKRGILLHSAQ